MYCKRITEMTDALEQSLFELALSIEDPGLNITAFGPRLRQTQDIGLFGIFDPDLKGFIYAEKPNAVYPGRGYLYVTAVDPDIPFTVSKELFNMMCDWLISEGATYLWGWTKRNPKVIKRLYGFEVAAEQQVVRPLVGDAHLQVERINP